MPPDLLIDRVLEDEALVGDLDEREASALVAAMVERVRIACAETNDESIAKRRVEKLCENGRRTARIVAAFRDQGVADATRLTKAEGWTWPPTAITPVDLMRSLLNQWH